MAAVRKYGVEWQIAFQQFPELDRPAAGVTWPEYRPLVYTTNVVATQSRTLLGVGT